MKKVAGFFGSIILFLLGCTICSVLALFVVGSFLVTYPLLRLSPRDARLKAAMDTALAVTALVAALKPPPGQPPGEAVPSESEQATEKEEHDGAFELRQ